ncbi:MAG: hypothetical protein AAF228_08450 [Pseudomonadota bacterium]
MTKKLPEISSFAAPTENDIKAFHALTPEQQQDMIDAELAKSLEGEPIPLSEVKDILDERWQNYRNTGEYVPHEDVVQWMNRRKAGK